MSERQWRTAATRTRSWISDCTSLARRRHGIVCRRLGVISLRPDRLLATAPNPWLTGRVHLGLSVIATLCGAPLEAVEHARQAVECASVSGHRRTHVGGRVNLSHALQALGRWDEARTCIDTVLSERTTDFELRVAALDCSANLSIAEGELDKSEQILADLQTELTHLASPSGSRWASYRPFPSDRNPACFRRGASGVAANEPDSRSAQRLGAVAVMTRGGIACTAATTEDWSQPVTTPPRGRF